MNGMHVCYEKSDQGCLDDLARELAINFSLSDILAVLGKYEARDKIFLEKCHTLAHYLGQ